MVLKLEKRKVNLVAGLFMLFIAMILTAIVYPVLYFSLSNLIFLSRHEFN
jgi:uncharacterized membrane protein YqjE